MDFKKACIFVDGENLRHSLVDLFDPTFNPSDYLPKKADWDGFFKFLVNLGQADLRLRAYWYVVDEIDFFPYGVSRLFRNGDFVKLEHVLCLHKPHAVTLGAIADPATKQSTITSLAQTLIKTEAALKR
jgi:hypothetical protein